MKNARGQVSVEIVLMLVVSVSIVAAVMQGFKSNSVFSNLVSGPWQSLAGLIQNGSLGPPGSTMANHPNQFDRVSSPRADQPKPPPGG
jgi:hypothetical protein